MKEFRFAAASAVYAPFASPEEAAREQKEKAVSQFGFHTSVVIPEGGVGAALLRVSARHVYRLYINGKIIMHGPARTAHGYARVDEIDVTAHLVPGVVHVALEVMTYGDFYNGYSNDMSINDGPGFVIAELLADGQVLTATGRDAWDVSRLDARSTHVARLSHCREASEVYYLNDAYTAWRMGGGDPASAAPTDAPVFLPHESLLPTLAFDAFDELVGFGACEIREDANVEPLFFEQGANYSPAGYLDSLPENALLDCRRTVDRPQSGVRVTRKSGEITISGAESVYLLLDGKKNTVGFPTVDCTCEKDGVIDVVHTELLNLDGSFTYNHNVVTRLHVRAGRVDFTAMEPGLGRWLKLYFRGTGKVTLRRAGMLDYAYPDEKKSSFFCSDDNVNRLYEAAKLTLRLNTLDIFMDCPDRERGGWLCDSLWTSRAAALMLSDTRVEREFLENFLLTPADGMFRGFFPEAYPGNKPSFKDMTGITTWSFWLMCQFVEYIGRTNDTEMRDTYANRIAAFVDGSTLFIGKSGLLENLPWVFIDWSMSNYAEYHQPVSTAANALYAYMLTELGRLYDKNDWMKRGQTMRSILRAAIAGKNGEKLAALTSFPDSFTVDENGELHGRGRTSETGMATALWAGLFSPGETPALDRSVRDCMGPAPMFYADPDFGKSQLFIGLCIRLDMLTRRGHYNKMYEDLHAIYDPQLREGPGTLWETSCITASSRCHGFTSHTGVHLMRDVLGMSLIRAAGKSVTIAPHLCGLRWARGTQETADGLILVSWTFDGDSFAMEVSLPAGYTADVVLPREVRALDADRVRVNVVAQG